MKIKVDDIVINEVTKSGKPKTQIALDIGLSRGGLGKILDNTEMESKYILAIGKSIRYDFTKVFPQLNSDIVNDIVAGNTANFDTANSIELKDQLLEIQQKYIRLLESHVVLLRQLQSGPLGTQ